MRDMRESKCLVIPTIGSQLNSQMPLLPNDGQFAPTARSKRSSGLWLVLHTRREVDVSFLLVSLLFT